MFHKVILIGNLGSDPEMKYTPSGKAVTTISVATTTKITKGDRPCPDGWKESYNGKSWELTTWWRVSTWGNTAEACNQYLAKGSQVYIEGEVKGAAVNGSQNPRVWMDKNGVPQASYELTARVVKFLGGRGETGTVTARDEDEPPGYQPDEENPF